MSCYRIISALFLAVLRCSLMADEKPLMLRGQIDGKAFSEVGRLYVDNDRLIHFRTDQRLYYFSHMYYIWDALTKAGVVSDGKIARHDPIRITGNYSKAAYVYNFLEEPALRGSQIVWIDLVEKAESLSEREEAFAYLFDGKSLQGWSATSNWQIADNAFSCLSPSTGIAEQLMSHSSHTDFELSFEYRGSWGTSASLLIRANKKGDGISLSLDHIDEGTVGFPKSAAGASRPYSLHENREKRGVGAATQYHIQYEGHSSHDAVAHNKLIECAQLSEFLREWDGGFWNIVRVRCVGTDPEITFWINDFLISKFKANTAVLREKNPTHIGAIENYEVHPSGGIGFVVHSMKHEKPEFLVREVRVLKLDKN